MGKSDNKPSFSELVRVSARIGCLSFGGPAGQIALMHQELVEERGWINEAEYLHALNFCHLLPGPEAQQLATWIGWRLHGVKGGLAAITAAIVGVIANLSLWFTVHVLFAATATFTIAGRSLALPVHSSLNWAAALLSLIAAILIFRFHLGLIKVLGIMMVLGLALNLPALDIG